MEVLLSIQHLNLFTKACCKVKKNHCPTEKIMQSRTSNGKSHEVYEECGEIK
jgi:hypothetical protein